MPEFAPSKKGLPIIFMIDVSGSMENEKISAVNEAMGKMEAGLKKFSAKYPLIDFSIRVMTFGNDIVKWKIGSTNKGMLLNDYNWIDIFDSEVDGGTPTDKAIEFVGALMGNDYKEYLGGYIGTPLVVLVSDGDSNGRRTVQEATDDFRRLKAGSKTFTVAIGIGSGINQKAENELKYFGRNGYIHCTDDPQQIIDAIDMATFKSLQVATEVSIKAGGEVDPSNESIF